MNARWRAEPCDLTRRGEACCSAVGSDAFVCEKQTSLPCRLCCRKYWRDGKIRRCRLPAGNHMAWAPYSTQNYRTVARGCCHRMVDQRVGLQCELCFQCAGPCHSTIRCAVIWCAAKVQNEFYETNIFFNIFCNIFFVEMNLIASYWIMNHHLIIFLISTQVLPSLSEFRFRYQVNMVDMHLGASRDLKTDPSPQTPTNLKNEA